MGHSHDRFGGSAGDGAVGVSLSINLTGNDDIDNKNDIDNGNEVEIDYGNDTDDDDRAGAADLGFGFVGSEPELSHRTRGLDHTNHCISGSFAVGVSRRIHDGFPNHAHISDNRTCCVAHDA